MWRGAVLMPYRRYWHWLWGAFLAMASAILAATPTIAVAQARSSVLCSSVISLPGMNCQSPNNSTADSTGSYTSSNPGSTAIQINLQPLVSSSLGGAGCPAGVYTATCTFDHYGNTCLAGAQFSYSGPNSSLYTYSGTRLGSTNYAYLWGRVGITKIAKVNIASSSPSGGVVSVTTGFDCGAPVQFGTLQCLNGNWQNVTNLIIYDVCHP